MQDVADAKRHLYSVPGLHGVMIGRQAQAHPCMLVEADALYGDQRPALTRRQALDEYCAYLETRYEGEDDLTTGRVSMAVRPMHGLFHGLRNGRRWRIVVDDCIRDPAVRPEGPAGVLRAALAQMEPMLDHLDDPIGPDGTAGPRQRRECSSAAWLWTCWGRERGG